jgi:hypothetical protein
MQADWVCMNLKKTGLPVGLGVAEKKRQGARLDCIVGLRFQTSDSARGVLVPYLTISPEIWRSGSHERVQLQDKSMKT